MKKRFIFLTALMTILLPVCATACGDINGTSLPNSNNSSVGDSVEDNSSSDSSSDNSDDNSSDNSGDNSSDNSGDNSSDNSDDKTTYIIYYYLLETDETEYKIQIVEMGEIYTLTTNVEREGYMLSYWKDKETGKRYYPQNGEWTWSKEGDMSLIAVWALDWNANPDMKDDEKWSDFYV